MKFELISASGANKVVYTKDYVLCVTLPRARLALHRKDSVLVNLVQSCISRPICASVHPHRPDFK